MAKSNALDNKIEERDSLDTEKIGTKHKIGVVLEDMKRHDIRKGKEMWELCKQLVVCQFRKVIPRPQMMQAQKTSSVVTRQLRMCHMPLGQAVLKSHQQGGRACKILHRQDQQLQVSN